MTYSNIVKKVVKEILAVGAEIVKILDFLVGEGQDKMSKKVLMLYLEDIILRGAEEANVKTFTEMEKFIDAIVAELFAQIYRLDEQLENLLKDLGEEDE